MRLAVIANLTARDGKAAKFWPKVHAHMLERGLEVQVHETQHVGHAAEIAHSLKDSEDIDLVVAMGGDGSVHEVASGLRGSEMRLGIIPTGTGNDYARAHAIPLKDIPGMVSILIEGVDRHAGALRLEGRPAAAHTLYPAPASNPWDGEPRDSRDVVRWVFLESDGGVTSAVSRMKTEGRAKRIRGSMKYTWLGIVSIFGWKRRKAWIRIDDEPGRLVDLAGLYCCCMCETFGGGYRVAPGTHPMQGHGTLVMAYGLSKFKMLNLMGPLRKGRHVGKWGITLQSVRRFEIRAVDESDEPTDEPHEHTVWIQADGEPCMTTPACLEFHADQIWVRGAKSIPNLD